MNSLQFLKAARMVAYVICFGAHSHAAHANSVSFAKKIVPILESRCAGCHMTGDEPGEMALVSDTAHRDLLKQSAQAEHMQIVSPGDPLNSYLMMKLEGKQLEVGGHGARMPMATSPLTEHQLQLFRDWILQGAIPN